MAYQRKGNNNITRSIIERHRAITPEIRQLMMEDKQIIAINKEMEYVTSVAPIKAIMKNGKVEYKMHEGAEQVLDSLREMHHDRWQTLLTAYGVGNKQVHREDREDQSGEESERKGLG